MLPTSNNIHVNLPTNKQLFSSHTTTMNLPRLSVRVKNAHIFLELKFNNLLSINQLCDNKCVCIFTRNKLRDIKEQILILEGTRDLLNGIWNASTTLQNKPSNNSLNIDNKLSNSPKVNLANYLVETKLLGDCIIF